MKEENFPYKKSIFEEEAGCEGSSGSVMTGSGGYWGGWGGVTESDVVSREERSFRRRRSLGQYSALMNENLRDAFTRKSYQEG